MISMISIIKEVANSVYKLPHNSGIMRTIYLTIFNAKGIHQIDDVIYRVIHYESNQINLLIYSMNVKILYNIYLIQCSNDYISMNVFSNKKLFQINIV